MKNLDKYEERTKIALTLVCILTTLEFKNDEDVNRHVKSLELVSQKINADEESFKTVMGNTAHPYLKIMGFLIDLYKSDKIDVQKKSDITTILRDTIFRSCDRAYPGFSCSLAYISNAGKLTGTEYPEDIKPVTLKLYDALIKLCNDCPYKKPIETR